MADAPLAVLSSLASEFLVRILKRVELDGMSLCSMS